MIGTNLQLKDLCRHFTIKNGHGHNIFGFRYINKDGFLGYYDAAIEWQGERKEFIGLKCYVQNKVISVDLPWPENREDNAHIAQEVRELLKEFIIAQRDEMIRKKNKQIYSAQRETR